MNSGIYMILNLINGKYYIGYAKNFIERWDRHINDLNNNNHHNYHLQNAWNLYGEKNFQFDILDECEEEFLCSMEHYWCNLLLPHNKNYGYNIAPTNPFCKPCMAEETKLRISLANKGKEVKPETRAKISNTLMGHEGAFKKGMHTEESKNKISLGNKGKIRTKEHKEILRIARTGKKLSEETRERMRNSHNHHSPSEEGKKRISEAKSVPILQFDLEMNFIRGWKSVTEAKKYYGGDIPAALKGDQKTSKGFIWKYKE